MAFKIILPLLLIVSVFGACHTDKNRKKVVVTKEMLMKHNRKLLNLEAEVIQKYLEKNQLQMLQSPTGMWYRFIVDSVGINAHKNQLVHLDYKISLLNDQLCYSFEKDGPLGIVTGKGDTEAGLQEALLMASEGDSLQLILPPHLAYGLAGDGRQVPGQAILKYDIKILKIENLNE